MKGLLVTTALCLAATTASASDVMECTFDGGLKFYVATTDDHEARIGTAPGIGDKGWTFDDLDAPGARVVIELNTSGVPITMTTIQVDGVAVHSRHSTDFRGMLVAPSQARCLCKKVVDTAAE